MKIGELARRSGRSAHTLRYYERIGLLPPPRRDDSGQRDYDASVLVWLAFLERLRATGRAYVEFALAEPGFFAVAFAAVAHEGVAAHTPAEGAAAADPYALLTLALDDLVEVGAMGAERREGAEVACWSAVHGFAVLHIDGPLRDVPARERDRQLEVMLDALEHALA